MPADADWLKAKLEDIARKRAVLGALQNSLDAWERDVAWGELPEAKRAALLKLARESTATLRVLISRVSGQIDSSLTAIAQAGPDSGREA